MTVDPESEEADQESWNPYHFGLDNPIRYNDPDGRNPIYGVLRVAQIGWRVLRRIEAPPSNPIVRQEAIRVSKQTSSDRNFIAVRDASSTAIKPVILKNSDEPIPIYIDAEKHPESAGHAKEVEGKDGVIGSGTIDRKGASERRKENLKGKEKENGKDRDEYPPAVLKPDGKTSVKNISSPDNRGAGSSMGHQMRKLPDGTKVVIKVKDKNGN